MTRREQIFKICELSVGKLNKINAPVIYGDVTVQPSKSLDFAVGAERENARLLPIIKIILEENEKLRVALEFYADKYNYQREKGSEAISRATGRPCYDILLWDLERSVDGPSGIADYSGERARQVLASSPLDELLKGVRND
jgi:hypothetical protein